MGSWMPWYVHVNDIFETVVKTCLLTCHLLIYITKVYEMLFGFTPFYVSGIDQKGLFKRIVRGKWSIPKEHNKVNRSAIEFVWGLLQRRPAERLGCLAGGYRDIKKHAWLQEVNFGKLLKKQIQAPWVPDVTDPLDTSNFESLDDAEDEDFLSGKTPLTAKEQIVFQDF